MSVAAIPQPSFKVWDIHDDVSSFAYPPEGRPDYGSRAPFYRLVPKDPRENVLWRKKIASAAAKDPGLRQDLVDMCARDILFYVNTFGWTFDPRLDCSAIPFVTWPFQDEAFLDIIDAMGKSNLPLEKTRDMGASWILLIAIEWVWHFKYLQTFLLISRKEEYVYKKGDPKTLFWKIEFFLEHLPAWLKPKFYPKKLHLENLDNGSTIEGESANQWAGRAGRFTAVLGDEFAFIENGRSVLSSIRGTTKSLFLISTANGTANAHYGEIKRARGNGKPVLRFHWSQHPHKNPGAYRTRNGVLEIVDQKYPFGKDYPFILDGKLRSPWFDEQEREMDPVEFASEIEISYLGSQFQFFDTGKIREIEAKTCRAPGLVGSIVGDEITYQPDEFLENASKPLKLWLELDPSTMAPPEEVSYVIGADISMGKNRSRSVYSVADRFTGEKVAEYAVNNLNPQDFAGQTVMAARWFNNAFLIWEANGPGREFGDTVIDLGYRNIYYRKNDATITKKVSELPGWHSSKDEKRALLGGYYRRLRKGLFVNPSEEALEETLQYIMTPTGIKHSVEANAEDAVDKDYNHGDIVIADSLCAKLTSEMRQSEREQKSEHLDSQSIMGRRVRRRKELVESGMY